MSADILFLNSFSSFVESQGQPLVDLSLYVSSENYTSSTRGAYSGLLQWPGQWITPHKVRAAAKLRSDHLGLSSLDLDTAEQPEMGAEAPRAVHIPQSLVTRPKETVSSFLGRSSHRSQFRLDALASGFYGPLQEVLGGSKYFFSATSPSSLDCLALGYLALALHPRLPHEWLRNSLVEKFPDLARYTETSCCDCFGPPLTIYDALLQNLAVASSTEPKGKAAESKLPWQAPERPSIAAIGRTIIDNVVESTPVIGEMRQHSRMQKASKDPQLDDEESRRMQKIAKLEQRELYSRIAFVAASLSAFVGYLFYEGLISIKHSNEEEENREGRDFGDAGAMLGI